LPTGGTESGAGTSGLIRLLLMGGMATPFAPILQRAPARPLGWQADFLSVSAYPRAAPDV